MKQSRGFTIIEIIVTISVMLVLMAVSIVALRSTQVDARDQERKTDVESIARGLEQRYTTGNARVLLWPSKGAYPGNNEMLYSTGTNYWCTVAPPAKFDPCQASTSYLYELLPGTTEGSFKPPDSSVQMFKNMWGATDANRLTYISNGNYVYAPLDRTGANCNNDCTSFKLYYKKESDGSTQVIKSKRQ
jgi:prepilin-type N-terminal cleavage/methylation domain-containing protein